MQHILDMRLMHLLINRTMPLRLAAALAEFRLLAPRLPHNQRLKAWAERILELSGPDLIHWHAEAWWGYLASMAVINRLRHDRHAEVLELMDPPDWTRLPSGAGLVLVNAHAGPSLTAALAARYCGRPLLVYGTNTLLSAQQFLAAEAKHQGLAAGLAHLRSGGAVLISPDGHLGARPRQLPFMGGMVGVMPGAAHLARSAGVGGFWLVQIWRGERIGFNLEPMPPSHGKAEDVELAWAAAYLARLEATYRADPRNLRLEGGFWRPGGHRSLPRESVTTHQPERW